MDKPRTSQCPSPPIAGLQSYTMMTDSQFSSRKFHKFVIQHYPTPPKFDFFYKLHMKGGRQANLDLWTKNLNPDLAK